MKQGFQLKVVPVVMLAIASMFACARTLAVEPANMQAGPIYFTPTLSTDLSYVDNIFRSTNNERSSWVLELTPRIQAWAQSGNNTYSLSYQLQDSTYASFHDDDFTDHQVNLDIHQEFNVRNVLNLFGEYYNGHEERGTGLTEGDVARLVEKPVEYDLTTLGGDYTFGSRESRGRLELAAQTAAYEYQNFRQFTAFRDRDEDTYSGTFFWKVGQRTDVLGELRIIRNRYDNTNPGAAAGSLDSDEVNYLVGINWDATARTSGSIKVGWYDREFNSASRSDSDGFQWEVDLTYKPRTYSVINLKSRRYSQETNALGDFIDSSEVSFAWDHHWTSRGRSHLSMMFGTDEYSGSTREDDRRGAEASYSYQLKRWFDLGLGYRHETRNSDIRSLDYSYNVYFIEVELSL